MDIEATVKQHLEYIRELQSSGGLFLASAQGVETGYDKAWLRDNFYTVMAFEETGDWEVVHQAWRAILHIFAQHRGKIQWAAENRPLETWQYIHARYHPETFDEFWEEWGNKQNDAVGAILFKLGHLTELGQSVVNDPVDYEMVQILVDYVASIEYWHDPDNGIWEEYEEVHASSVGAVVAGLKKVSEQSLAQVPPELIEHGENTLRDLLPRESESKFCDLALLSLIYPYNEAGSEMADEILNNLHYQFDRDRGVIRYKNDYYYNKNDDGFSEEAEWVMGFPWLSIIYSRRGEQEKARHYLHKTLACRTEEGKLPELYYSNSPQPNENIPLGWAESLLVVALKEYGRCFETQEV